MIQLDGSQGEGGGQIIRSSLALSLVTGQPIRIRNVRGKRRKPGLLKQHLTALRAAQQIADADVTGATLHSTEFKFTPQKATHGSYQFDIGSAGSATLVLQTILPALMLSSGESEVLITGGTHNRAAPPFDFLQECYLPVVNKMGPKVTAKLLRHGFYPAGGGQMSLRICGNQRLGSVSLVEHGGSCKSEVRALVAQLPSSIGERECKVVRSKLNLPVDASQVETVDSSGPGNVVMASLCYPKITELFCAFGERGVRAEDVAKQLCKDVNRYLDSKAVVGEYLCDQLMLPFALAAADGQTCQMLTHELSSHSQTHVDVIKEFLPVQIKVVPQADTTQLVEVGAE